MTDPLGEREVVRADTERLDYLENEGLTSACFVVGRRREWLVSDCDGEQEFRAKSLREAIDKAMRGIP